MGGENSSTHPLLRDSNYPWCRIASFWHLTSVKRNTSPRVRKLSSFRQLPFLFLTLRSSVQNEPSVGEKGDRLAQQAAHWSARKPSAALIGGASRPSRPCRLFLRDRLLTGEKQRPTPPLGGDVTCEVALRAAVVMNMTVMWGCGSFQLLSK